MCVVAIIGSGPKDHVPHLEQYKQEVDIWIGADRGALLPIENGINLHYAVGDFDSVDEQQKAMIIDKADDLVTYPSVKNETDLEIALQKAIELKAQKIYLFGVTGGRLDHALINMQLLRIILEKGVRGIIIDQWNRMELTKPGTYKVYNRKEYPYVSFVPFTQDVKGLSLKGFAYPLEDFHLNLGSTRCISNELIAEEATFSYDEGMLLVIQSCDVELTCG